MTGSLAVRIAVQRMVDLAGIPVTERDRVDAHLVKATLDILSDDAAFGYRFVAEELLENGIEAGENKGPAHV